MGSEEKNYALLVDEKKTWVAAMAALQSPNFFAQFNSRGADDLNWWYDVRRRVLMLGTKCVTDAELLAYKAWMASKVVHQNNFGGHGVLVPSRDALFECVSVLCHANPRDEVAEYLETLRSSWDSVPRIDGELPARMGLGGDKPHEALWLRKWLIGAVARGLRPGCKMDAALLLVGAQGIGKSTGVAALFGDEWTHDSQVNLEDKDGAAIMGRAWCVELAELSSMRRAKDVDSVKHFLSLREDTYRAPYERIATTTPRRAVVCGTTNDDAPLSDSTGNRRFWPLTVRRKIDVPWLAANRDAVWAEAVAALDSGEAWYLDDIAAATQALEAENYTHQDELVEALRTWAETVGEEGTTIRQAAGAIDVEDKDLDWHLQRRIASALRVLGLERGFVRADGEKHRRWVYPIGG